jgi:hypothetical protein
MGFMKAPLGVGLAAFAVEYRALERYLVHVKRITM